MNPQDYVCQNESCKHFGLSNGNHITVHSQQQKRLRCKTCRKTFSHTKGTAFYRLHTEEDVVVKVMILLAFGCPSAAIEKAYGLDARTLKDWQVRFGTSAKHLHNRLFYHILAHVRVQCDELYVKMWGKVLWVANAIEIESRLWVSVKVSRSRTNFLIKKLLEDVKFCLIPLTKVYFETDGLASYKSQILKVFRYKVPGKTRWKYAPWKDLVLVQIIKTYRKKGKKYLFEGLDKIKCSIGSWSKIGKYVRKFGIHVVNTAYVERLNATLRGQLAPLVRRGRAIKKEEKPLEHLLYLKRTLYNLATEHKSLKVGKKQQTPAMKAGICKKKIPFQEILKYNKNVKNNSKFKSTF